MVTSVPSTVRPLAWMRQKLFSSLTCSKPSWTQSNAVLLLHSALIIVSLPLLISLLTLAALVSLAVRFAVALTLEITERLGLSYCDGVTGADGSSQDSSPDGSTKRV
jgi:hypothetical protein